VAEGAEKNRVVSWGAPHYRFLQLYVGNDELLLLLYGE